ncbi:VPLPA-CTERM-specific exosortase XrtD [Jannaschia sp. LMIT008]|uniref:VPLPA-CTERM-specific exosortase XrtD n=1 Tax=Jannaschia maritima TaxID=3032585 RepID=UPI00281189BE|nr:VPLPA-CTERM-specific exosortase XrtD [Jannaschia sp. LMIT008]
MRFATPGVALLVLSVLAAAFFFRDGIDALLRAWQLPEYSHGPLIPVLSALLFLRQLKDVPENHGPVSDRWPGVALLIVALALGAVGKVANIEDIVAYALILWVGATILISFGWSTGKQFWPGVLHLVYMLPLPGVLYYKISTVLQAISSELGVWMLRLIDVPVFLDGNIIDLGVLKLHVAEACSGLRYLFPILSFSYVFACLYRGPVWHKAVLLLAAVPITVVMNSVRIAFGGWIANRFGIEWLEGFTHFFEGWVIFLICVVLLFLLAWAMLKLQRSPMTLPEALDLEMSGLPAQMARVRLVRPSPALIAGTVAVVAGAAAFFVSPPPERVAPDREPFVLFPTALGEWRAGAPLALTPEVAAALGADDYHSIDLVHPDAAAPVGLFMAYYEDQTKGGIHSPEICLPGSGWEIAWLERVDLAPTMAGRDDAFNINRAIIQKGEARMMVYYWFAQHGHHTAWDFAAKMQLVWSGITAGRTDGALVRILTRIHPNEDDAAAEARLRAVFDETVEVLPRFVPEL